MLKLSGRKKAIFSLKKQIHPWDVAAEEAKEKHPRTYNKTQTLSNGSDHTLIIAPETSPETLDNDLDSFSHPEGPTKGFFPCPFCTCWFSHKRHLDSHVRKWCDRARSKVIFIKQKNR